MELEMEGRNPVSGSKKSWGKVVEEDRRKLNIAEDIAEEATWYPRGSSTWIGYIYSIVIGSTCPAVLTSCVIGESETKLKRRREKPIKFECILTNNGAWCRRRNPALIRRWIWITKVYLWHRLQNNSGIKNSRFLCSKANKQAIITSVKYLLLKTRNHTKFKNACSAEMEVSMSHELKCLTQKKITGNPNPNPNPNPEPKSNPNSNLRRKTTESLITWLMTQKMTSLVKLQFFSNTIMYTVLPCFKIST